MKKLVTFMRKNSLSMVSAVGMMVGIFAVSTMSWLGTNQPECPQELLK